MHAEADSSGGVALAEQLRDLAIGHYTARGNTPHNFINTLAILWVFFNHRLNERSQNHSRRSAVAFVAS